MLDVVRVDYQRPDAQAWGLDQNTGVCTHKTLDISAAIDNCSWPQPPSSRLSFRIV